LPFPFDDEVDPELELDLEEFPPLDFAEAPLEDFAEPPPEALAELPPPRDGADVLPPLALGEAPPDDLAELPPEGGAVAEREELGCGARETCGAAPRLLLGEEPYDSYFGAAPRLEPTWYLWLASGAWSAGRS
jgi:hypothetical protein